MSFVDSASNVSPFQVGALGLGAAGLAMTVGQGEPALPAQFNQLQQSVPLLQAEGGNLQTQGVDLLTQGQNLLPGAQALTAEGGATLDLAAQGQLTGPQQAQLDQYQTGLTNQSRQMLASMGRNPDQDTAYIGLTADNDAKANAMAQQDIQSSIALGLGQLQAGSSATGQALGFEQAGLGAETSSLGFESAADQALIAAGNAQVAEDSAYSTALTNSFSSIAKMFGSIAGGIGGFAIGGPGGAAVGSAAGGALGSEVS